MSDIVYSRHCSKCDIDWPNHSGDYGKCPVCEKWTYVKSGVEPMDETIAMSMKSHADFDRFYQDWCATRDQREVNDLESIMTASSAVDGPSLAA